MYETPDDLVALQELLDRSRQGAGAHLADIMTPERWLTAPALAAKLQKMSASAAPRPRSGPGTSRSAPR